MRVSELQGAELDYWVAKATGREMATRSTGLVVRFLEGGPRDWREFHPSTDWSIAGPIIERERIWLSDEDGGWIASLPRHVDTATGRDLVQSGPTALIAACRAFVAFKFGAEVPAPPQTPERTEIGRINANRQQPT